MQGAFFGMVISENVHVFISHKIWYSIFPMASQGNHATFAYANHRNWQSV
jgi:hypothetical protein